MPLKEKMRMIIAVYLQRSELILYNFDNWSDEELIHALKKRSAAFHNLKALDFRLEKELGSIWLTEQNFFSEWQLLAQMNDKISDVLEKRLGSAKKDLAKMLAGRKTLGRFRSGSSEVTENIQRSV